MRCEYKCGVETGEEVVYVMIEVHMYVIIKKGMCNTIVDL